MAMAMATTMVLMVVQASAGGATVATATPSTLSGSMKAPVAAPRSRAVPALPAKPGVHTGVPVTPATTVAPVGVSAPIRVPPSAVPRPDRAHVRAAVDAEWRHYDLRGTGRLGPLEFATWVMRANGATVAVGGAKGAPGIRPISAMNATARAFARADANHDGGVTPDEMTDFLMR